MLVSHKLEKMIKSNLINSCLNVMKLDIKVELALFSRVLNQFQS